MNRHVAVLALLAMATAHAVDIHVVPGRDGGDGGPARPYGSLLAARDAARSVLTARKPVTVILHDGLHSNPEDLYTLDPERHTRPPPLARIAFWATTSTTSDASGNTGQECICMPRPTTR